MTKPELDPTLGGNVPEVFLPAKDAAKLLWGPAFTARMTARDFHAYMEHFDFVPDRGKVPTDKAIALGAARPHPKHGWAWSTAFVAAYRAARGMDIPFRAEVEDVWSPHSAQDMFHQGLRLVGKSLGDQEGWGIPRGPAADAYRELRYEPDMQSWPYDMGTVPTAARIQPMVNEVVRVVDPAKPGVARGLVAMRRAMDWLMGYDETSPLTRYGFLYRDKGWYAG